MAHMLPENMHLFQLALDFDLFNCFNFTTLVLCCLKFCWALICSFLHVFSYVILKIILVFLNTTPTKTVPIYSNTISHFHTVLVVFVFITSCNNTLIVPNLLRVPATPSLLSLFIIHLTCVYVKTSIFFKLTLSAAKANGSNFYKTNRSSCVRVLQWMLLGAFFS